MKVADLQQHLADLARLLESAGARSVASELVLVQEALKPFGNQSLKSFAEFLPKAYQYAETGIVPGPAPTGKNARAASSKTKAVPGDVQRTAEELKLLYDRSSSPQVSFEMIESFVQTLEPLTKPHLVLCAEAIGLVGMNSKTKPQILDTIRRRLTDRKGAALRVSGIAPL